MTRHCIVMFSEGHWKPQALGTALPFHQFSCSGHPCYYPTVPHRAELGVHMLLSMLTSEVPISLCGRTCIGSLLFSGFWLPWVQQSVNSRTASFFAVLWVSPSCLVRWAPLCETCVNTRSLFSKYLCKVQKGPKQPFLASLLYSSKPTCSPLRAELPEILW